MWLSLSFSVCVLCNQNKVKCNNLHQMNFKERFEWCVVDVKDLVVNKLVFAHGSTIRCLLKVFSSFYKSVFESFQEIIP